MKILFPFRVSRAVIGSGLAVVVALAGTQLGEGLAQSASSVTVPYPEEYRTWPHVKTVLVSARHADFERSGGFRHIYANPQAIAGYRTGLFPEGSIIVVDWLEGKDESGMFSESTRRRLDVMVKDGTKFAATAGWGWERFKGDSKTERTVTSAATQCVSCHSGPGTRDLVFSRFRD